MDRLCFRQTARGCRLAVYVGVMLAWGGRSGYAAPPKTIASGPDAPRARARNTDPVAPPPSFGDDCMALLEPSLADGFISDSEAIDIISAAQKTFTDSQVAELKLLLDELVADRDGQTRPANGVEQSNRTEFDAIIAVSTGTPDDSVYVEAVELDAIAGTYEEGLCDNLSLSATFEAFKGPMALGDLNDNCGVRLGVNWGYPLWDECGLGVQLGTAAMFANFNGREFAGDDDRFQSFTTAGLFQRHNGFHWALAHDFLLDDYDLRYNLHQWRGQIGCEVTPNDEVGIWAATADNGDRDDLFLPGPRGVGAAPVVVEEHRDPITQGNLFWRHLWGHDTATRVWVGVADGHGGCVVGGDARAPLGDMIALVAEASLLSDEIWSLSIGIAVYPSRTSRQANYNRYAPLLPVANNGTFAVDRP